jgi:Biotin/lipoate A/B protein ligase family
MKVSASAMRAGSERQLHLPPPFTSVTLREVGDAFAHACRLAAEDVPGTLVSVGRFDLVEFAVILAPEEPLQSARRVLYCGGVALARALAAHAPPQKAITFEWPDALRVDGGLIGGIRLGWPEASAEDETPDWLVFGAMLRAVALGEEEPGLTSIGSALNEEGFDDFAAERLVENFARQFMSALNRWHDAGFAAIAAEYLRLLPADEESPEIAANGDLLVLPSPSGKAHRRVLKDALATPSWLDPATGVPWR